MPEIPDKLQILEVVHGLSVTADETHEKLASFQKDLEEGKPIEASELYSVLEVAKSLVETQSAVIKMSMELNFKTDDVFDDIKATLNEL